MGSERYPGEQSSLALFLESLLPIASDELGDESLLVCSVRRALRTRRLDHLRHARQLFNFLPRSLKQKLSRSMIAPSHGDGSEPSEQGGVSDRDRGEFICFRADATGVTGAATGDVGAQLQDDDALCVVIRPDTLPTDAADRLRRIADLIATDRRLLSHRFWRGRPRERREGEADIGIGR